MGNILLLNSHRLQRDPTHKLGMFVLVVRLSQLQVVVEEEVEFVALVEGQVVEQG